MQSRASRWSQINSSGKKIIGEAGQSKLTSSRFAPQRDYSRNSDKLFERSVDRFTSSFDGTVFNRGKGESPSQMATTIKQSSVLSKSESERKTANLMRFSTVNLVEKSELTEVKGTGEVKSNEVVSELKKEYLGFRRNILAELQRQRVMILKMVKEVILTMEFQFEKIAAKMLESSRPNQESFDPKICLEAKGIEDWKIELSKIPLIEPSRTQKYGKIEVSKPKGTNSVQKQPVKMSLPPPKPLLDLRVFESSIETMAKQVRQMDILLDISDRDDDK